MIKKVEFTRDEFLSGIQKIKDLIDNNSKFFFYFSPDPDAVGISIAFSLFLRNRNKECYIYLPEGFDQNLNFLFEIASYNSIIILRETESLEKIFSIKKPVIIICDTPTKFVLPNFEKILKMKNKYSLEQTVEIDHHFGGDSEQIFEKSISLFYKANSCCEIFADFLTQIEPDVNKAFPRNIVLNLLVGICFDTQVGKFVEDKENYDKWYDFLSKRLLDITAENSGYLKTSEEIFETISRMSETKFHILNNLVIDSKVINNVGMLVIPAIKMYESLSPNNDSTCIFSKVVSDLSDMIPEFAGKIGILAYYNDISDIYYLKIRRSFGFKSYDLRTAEILFKEIFGEEFIGGGGHPGAVSYRFKLKNRASFIEKAEKFHERLAEIILEQKGEQ
jgi:nanoRNase/pAp phosphatase (c-di-AMP/oligoRNAs hydrolase)